MVVGIDTYHDNAKGRQSIGGFVASMNQNCTRWYSRVCFQRPGQELAHGLHICLTNALKKYHSVSIVSVVNVRVMNIHKSPFRECCVDDLTSFHLETNPELTPGILELCVNWGETV